jgi:hypothetical protein
MADLARFDCTALILQMAARLLLVDSRALSISKSPSKIDFHRSRLCSVGNFTDHEFRPIDVNAERLTVEDFQESHDFLSRFNNRHGFG